MNTLSFSHRHSHCFKCLSGTGGTPQFLNFLTLTLFAYVATALTVNIPWSAALLATIWPKPTINTDYFLMVVAVLGTTISPYLFFWQASQEIEEMNQGKIRRPLRDLSRGGHGEIDRIKLDTIVGMSFSNVITFFIILTTAAVLNAGGITNINSATQAPEALRRTQPEAAHVRLKALL